MMYFVYVEYYYETDFKEFSSQYEAEKFIEYIKKYSSECVYKVILIKGDVICD